MDAAEVVIEPAVTAEIVGPPGALLTVTDTDAVPVLPPLSVAVAVTVCNPPAYLVVSQLALYAGPTVTGDPRFVLSTWNCTLVTLRDPFAAAVADTATVPDTVDPAVGAAIETVGLTVGAVVVSIAPIDG